MVEYITGIKGIGKTRIMAETAVATAETHHPLPHCAHIHCLVFTNILQCQ